MPRIINSRLSDARSRQDSAGNYLGSFIRSTVSGLTAGHLEAEDIPYLEDLPEAHKGIGKTLVETGGKIAGSIGAISAAQAGIAGLMGAIGLSGGALAPIIAGTAAGLAYTALDNTDMDTKKKEAGVTAILGAVAGALKLRGIGKAATALAKGAGKLEKAGKLDDLVIQGGKEVIEELRGFGALRGYDTKNLPGLLARATQDIVKEPTLMSKIPLTMEKVLSPHMTTKDGFINPEILKNMEEIGPIIAKESKRLIGTEAMEKGIAMANDWNEATLFGKIRMGIRKKVISPITKGLMDPGNLLASVPNGGMLYQKADEAVFIQNYLKMAAKINFEPIFDKLSKVVRRDKTFYKDLSTTISYALEDRNNATTLLDNLGKKYGKAKGTFASDVYQRFEQAFDFWRHNLERKGVGVLENYWPHMQETIQNPGKILGNFDPSVVASFLKKRTGTVGDFVRDDIIRVYNAYENVVSRKLAFDPVIEKWKELGSDQVIGKFLNGVISNRREPGGVIDWISGQRYKNLVAFNPFSAISNLAQQSLAEGHISAEAEKLARVLRKIKDPKIVEFLNRNFTHYAEEVVPKEFLEKVGKRSLFDKLKFFETAEGKNWLASRSLGVAEKVVQNPTFQKLRKSGMSAEKAVMETLQDKKIWEDAMVWGQDLASKTQFSMTQGFKPAFFESIAEHPLLRLPLQFRRFQFSNLETVFNLLRPRGRELAIYRRGLADEVGVVERLNAMRTLKSGLKRDIGKVAPDQRKIMRGMISELREDMGFLKDEIRRIEPRSFLRSSQKIGEMIVKGTAPKLARTWLKWGAAGYIFNKTYTGEKKAKDIAFTTAGQIPGMEMIRGMDISPRYMDPKYGLISTAMSVAPGIGLVDALLPGRPLTRVVNDLAFGKEKKEKRKKRTSR